MNNITINSILSFDEQSGLKISSKGEKNFISKCTKN